jgi:uncharacterized surface protein with fasciclin (FAS1) repeats
MAYIFDRVNHTTLRANIISTKTSNDGKSAIIRIIPRSVPSIIVFDNNEVTTIPADDTKAIVKKIKPLCEGSCGGDDSCPMFNFEQTTAHISSSDGDYKLCKVDDVRVLTRNGNKILELNVSVVGKNAALLRRKSNQTFTFVSTYSSLETVLNNLRMFSTLSTAVKAANLSSYPDAKSIFSGQKEYTIFPPINSAFEKLPSGTVESLLKPENKSKLRSILLNHVVSGRLSVDDIKKKKCLKTVGGKRLKVEVKEDDTVFVSGAKIVTSNFQLLNVTVQIINRVLQ